MNNPFSEICIPPFVTVDDLTCYLKKSNNEKRSGVGGHLGVTGGEALHGVGHLPRDAVAGIVRVLTRHVGVVDEAGKADNKRQ